MFVFLPERHPGDSPCILYGGARTGNRIGRSQRLRKTTMLKLISRLYDADSGTVQIGGTDIREIHTDSLFKYVSIVFQEVILFNTSIMEIFALGGWMLLTKK